MQALTPETSDPWNTAAREAVGRFDPTPTRVRAVASHIVSWASRVVMQWMNTTEIHGRALFEEARQMQNSGRGLLTFSNHVGLFDDPWLLACFAPPTWAELRWISADAHNFFGTSLKATISSMGKAVPIVRGAGVDQPGMHFLEERLAAGDWVHVFPEGGRSREPNAQLRRPFKAGLAHLIQRTRPVLLPFHHRGMHDVLPIGVRLPRPGNVVSLRFGPPCDSNLGIAEGTLEEITAWCETALLQLEATAFDAEVPA